MDPVADPLPQVSLKPLNFTVSYWLCREGDVDKVDLEAPYQRDSVWDEDRRRNLIRSMIMGVPIGAVTYSSLPHGVERYVRVIDGKQRIETVRAFTADEFTIPGWWVDTRWVDDPDMRARDLVYSDLNDVARRNFENYPFPSLEFDPAVERVRRDDEGRWVTRRRTADEMLDAEAEVYLLVNFGGVAHTDLDREHAQAQRSSRT